MHLHRLVYLSRGQVTHIIVHVFLDLLVVSVMLKLMNASAILARMVPLVKIKLMAIYACVKKVLQVRVRLHQFNLSLLLQIFCTRILFRLDFCQLTIILIFRATVSVVFLKFCLRLFTYYTAYEVPYTLSNL